MFCAFTFFPLQPGDDGQLSRHHCPPRKNDSAPVVSISEEYSAGEAPVERFLSRRDTTCHDLIGEKGDDMDSMPRKLKPIIYHLCNILIILCCLEKQNLIFISYNLFNFIYFINIMNTWLFINMNMINLFC